MCHEHMFRRLFNFVAHITLVEIERKSWGQDQQQPGRPLMKSLAGSITLAAWAGAWSNPFSAVLFSNSFCCSPLQGPFSHSQMVEWFKQVIENIMLIVSHSTFEACCFSQGFFNSTEMFLRRSGDRLFVSSRSTDLSSFFE